MAELKGIVRDRFDTTTIWCFERNDFVELGDRKRWRSCWWGRMTWRIGTWVLALHKWWRKNWSWNCKSSVHMRSLRDCTISLHCTVLLGLGDWTRSVFFIHYTVSDLPPYRQCRVSVDPWDCTLPIDMSTSDLVSRPLVSSPPCINEAPPVHIIYTSNRYQENMYCAGLVNCNMDYCHLYCTMLGDINWNCTWPCLCWSWSPHFSSVNRILAQDLFPIRIPVIFTFVLTPCELSGPRATTKHCPVKERCLLSQPRN